MSRPPVGAGIACAPHVRGCTHPTATAGIDAYRGHNDAQIITGTVGTAPNAAALPQAPETGQGLSEAPDLAQPLPDTLTQGEGEQAATGDAIELTPNLRLRALPEEPILGVPQDLSPEPAPAVPEADAVDPNSADEEPLDLATQPTAVAPMADAEELDLRSANTPIDLDPPVVDASFQAPVAASAEALDTAATPERGSGIEVASVEVGDTSQQFSGEISVRADGGTGPRMTLPEVVSRAATMHPEITLALAQVDEALSFPD